MMSEFTDSQLLLMENDGGVTDSQLLELAYDDGDDGGVTDSQLMQLEYEYDDDGGVTDSQLLQLCSGEEEEEVIQEATSTELDYLTREEAYALMMDSDAEDEEGRPLAQKRCRRRSPSPQTPSPCRSLSPPAPSPPVAWPQAQSMPMSQYDDDDEEEEDPERIHQYATDLWGQLLEPTPEFVPLEQMKTPPLPEDPYKILFDELLEPASQSGAGRRRAVASPPPSPQDDDEEEEEEEEAPSSESAGDYFTIETVQEKNCKKFHATSKEYKVNAQLRPRTDAKDAVMAALNIIERILEHVKADNQVGTTDQIRLVIDSKDLDYCIQLPFMPSNELTMLRVLRHLEAIVQSKRDFFLNGNLTVLVYHVRNLEGRGVSQMKRFNLRKKNETLPWLKTMATRGWVVVCGTIHEATAHYLHWREHGMPHRKESTPLLHDIQWVVAQLPVPEGAESLDLLLNHLNDMLRREKGFRVVVLDWGADDRPCFVGAGDEDEIMFLYKVDERLHLLLHPEKINHVDAHKGFCRRCFFFFWPDHRRKTAHVCGEWARQTSLSQVSGSQPNRSVRCDALNPEDVVQTKRSVVRIVDREDDPGGGGCAFRAIASAVWLAQHSASRARQLPEQVVNDNARHLCQRAGLTWGPCGMTELTQLQHVLAQDGIRLHVYYHHLQCVGFAGAWDTFAPHGPKHDIYLYHHDAHYDVIRSMKGFLSRNYYCHMCDKGYQHKTNHKCNAYCRCCYFPSDQCLSGEENTSWRECPRCRRTFKGEVCFANHVQATLKRDPKNRQSLLYSICDRYQKCPQCHVVIDVLTRRKAKAFARPENRHINDHRCGEMYCPHCKKTGPKHWCHVQPIFDSKDCPRCHKPVKYPHGCGDAVEEDTYTDRTEVRYLFFDVETMPGEEVHEVNLVVATTTRTRMWSVTCVKTVDASFVPETTFVGGCSVPNTTGSP